MRCNYSSINYFNYIYKGFKGHIEVCQIVDGTMAYDEYFNSNKSLKMKINSISDRYDYFASINSFNGKRTSYNCNEIRCLYIDLDSKNKNLTDYEKNLWLQELYYKVFNKKIPYPSMITWTGSGYHVYWKIEPTNNKAMYIWQELEDYLYYQLKGIGADKKATDITRILRIPQTINSKYDSNIIDNRCKVVFLNEEFTYNLFSLYEQYIGHKPIIKKPKKKNKILNERKNKISHGAVTFSNIKKVNNNNDKVMHNVLFNPYSLHMARIEDIKTLVRLRNYDVSGYRNMLVHCFAYWNGIYIRNVDELKELVNEFNNSFKVPLKQSEINCVLRCIPKAIEKFIAYEQGVKEGKYKRLTKDMKNKYGYWYKNQTLIDKLDITSEEQQSMKTIIGVEEKYRRNNIRRRSERRNENNRTQREEKKLFQLSEIQKLKLKNHTQKDISTILNISISTVKRNWNIAI